MILYLIIGIAVIIGVYLVSTYNFFATAKTRVEASIQEIGNQFKRQADLIPNLESSVKGYLKHEKGIFDELTNARKLVAGAQKSGSVEKMSQAGKAIADILPKIQVLVENNPEIKGSEVVKNLMDELRDTSDKIMYARRLMIDLTADYNVKIATFPSKFIAQLFHFGKLIGLETDEAEMKTPKINL